MIQHGSNGRKCHKWQSIYYPFFFFYLFYHQGRRDSKIKRKLFLIYFKINWNFQWKDNKIKKYNKINTLAWPVRLQWKWVVENPTYPGVPEIAANIFFHLLYTVLKDTREKNLMPFFVTTLLYIIIIIFIINFY